jgi:hypothetical protein
MGVTSLFAGGGGTHHSQPPAIRLAPSQSAAATTAITSAPKARALRAASSPTSTTVAATGGATTGGGKGLTHLFSSSTCAHTAKTGATSGQAGVNCAPYDSNTPALVVRVPLPDNPTNLKRVGVTSDKVDCSKLPKNRVARCVQQQDPSNSVSRSE